MAALYSGHNGIIHRLQNELLLNYTDDFINPQISAYRGLVIKAQDDRNKLLRQDNFWLAIKFGSTVKQPIPHGIRGDRFPRLKHLNNTQAIGVLGLMGP
jgi:hypothetical protein